MHAEGHFRQPHYLIKMLLSGYLHGGKLILADRKAVSARFFLFGEGKFFGETEDFAQIDWWHQGRQGTGTPNPGAQSHALARAN
jgi:hypothetical protein